MQYRINDQPFHYTNHCVNSTSVTGVKDTCTNLCVTDTSVTEMKDTCTNHCVNNTSVLCGNRDERHMH